MQLLVVGSLQVLKIWIAQRPPGFCFILMAGAVEAERSVTALDGTVVCGNRYTGLHQPLLKMIQTSKVVVVCVKAKVQNICQESLLKRLS